MQNEFSIKDSQVAKGMAVFLMFVHHLFLKQEYWLGYKLDFGIVGTERMMKIASFSKICVAVFIFLTAYGMTIKFGREVKQNSDLIKITSKKYISLITSYLFIFFFTQLLWMVLKSGENLRYYGTGLKALWSFLVDAGGISFFYSNHILNATWWYMSILLTMLVMLPFVWKMNQCIGNLVILAALVLPKALGTNDGPFVEYLPVLALGMVAADKNWIQRLANVGDKHFVLKLLKWLIYVVVLYGCFVIRNTSDYDMMIDPIAAFIVIMFGKEIVGKIPIVNNLLYAYGKYSFGIFMTHSLFILYFFNDYLFRIKNGLLIFVALAVVSLLLAVVLKKMEKICGIEKLKEYLLKKCQLI